MSTDDSKDGAALDPDQLLFQQEMAGVRPLRARGGATLAAIGKPPTSRKVVPSSKKKDLPRIPEDASVVRARIGGVSEETLRALSKGEFPIEATCNLHGYREASARDRIDSFLRESRQANRHVVAVVCGRGLHSGPGGPVLRAVTLQEVSKRMAKGDVLAATSAPARQGGDGALLLMLRRERR